MMGKVLVVHGEAEKQKIYLQIYLCPKSEREKVPCG
jgi:hypothetical protein